MKMNQPSIRLYYLICFFIFFSKNYVHGQLENSESEREFWTSVKYQQKLSKKFSITLEGQLRLNSFNKNFNKSHYNQSFFELESKTKISRIFEFGLAYRSINKYNERGNNNGIPYKRIHSFLKSELDLNRLSISSRIQYQTKFRGKLDFSNQIKKYWRKKIEFSYNFKNWKLDPKLGCEFFMKNNFLMHKDYKKYRIFFGTRFSGKEFGKIDVKYLLEKGVKSASSAPVHVLKIGYIIN